MHEEKLNDILNFDPLATAEKLTGESYKTSKETQSLGLALLTVNSAKKEQLLQAADDTSFRTRVEDYLRIAKSLGFEIVYQKPFQGNHNQEIHYILYDKSRGILLSVDTYTWEGQEATINGGSFYYNWEPAKRHIGNWYAFTSSGGMCQDVNRYVWVGHHDAREGLRFHINQLEKNGKFITPWIESPRPWLVPYNVRDNFRESIEQVFKQLPEQVQQACLGLEEVW